VRAPAVLLMGEKLSTGPASAFGVQPGNPARAFIEDWALTAGVITVFLEAGCGLLRVLMMAVAVRKRPLHATIQLGGDDPS
jgi:hypothetical protein